MIKSNFQNPILLISIGCFIATIAISALVLLPRFQDLEIIRKDIVRKQQTLQEERDFFSKIERYKREMNKYQEQLFKVASALPDDAETSLPSLFKFLQINSAQVGLILTEIGSFTISPVEGKEIKKTQFSFQVIGSYDSFQAFLEILERSARIIKVESISFSEPEEGLITFDIKVRVHSY